MMMFFISLFFFHLILLCRCPVLNGNKVKHDVSCNKKSALEKSIHFESLDLTEFLMSLVDLNMDIIDGLTYIKMILIFSPGIGKHFNGNTACSCDDSATLIIHILYFFMVNSVCYKSKGIIWRRGCRGLEISSDQEAPVQKGMNVMGETRWHSL